MRWYLETTEWTGASAPNHVYLMNDSRSKIYAYRPRGSVSIQRFKHPIKIDVRGRKFVVNPEQYPTDIQEEQSAARLWTVQGSKGDEYQVSEDRGNWACTCSGFKFRGQCRHIDNLRKSL